MRLISAMLELLTFHLFDGVLARPDRAWPN